MDGSLPFPESQIKVPVKPNDRAPPSRSFLFLQGPISTFFDRLGRALLARGHRVHRINLHGGDRLFWRLPALDYRGRLDDWRGFVADVMDREQITHLIVHGDRRPYHVVAAEEARARGIPVIATDLGYLRPDWITLEADGMTSYSRFPRDPKAIRAMAEEFPDPDLGQRFHTPFWTIAGLDIAYNIGLVFGRPLYPNYHYHSICHPFLEYAGWLWSRVPARRRAREAAAAKQRLTRSPGSYFLVPLQIATDYQIRAHSPFDDIRDAVRAIIASFAASTTSRELVFVAHPLDNGLIDWHRFIGDLAAEFGISGRVTMLSGGTPAEVLCNTAGMVTINSTIGITALQNGIPVKVLGNAVFDVPGLTCQEPLAAFWDAPQPPDPVLVTAFIRALAGATQVKGGYYRHESQDYAIDGFIDRFENGLYPLAPLSPEVFARRPARACTRTIVVAGASSAAGLAMARAYAVPGAQLILLGAPTAALKRAAADCRQRGALVEITASDAAVLTERLAALDSVAPLDTVILCGEASGEPSTEQLVRTDIIRAGDVIGAATGFMRARRQGSIILVNALTARAAPSDAGVAVRARRAWARYAAGLRQRCAADGIAVMSVSPGIAALRLAAWLVAPEIARIDADRVAAHVRRAAKQGRNTVTVADPAVVGRRALRLLPGKLCGVVRDIVLSVDETVPERAEEASLGKTGDAD